jgi:Ni,Fe-hydrogenase I small subunit
MSLLGMEAPGLVDLFRALEIEVLWHPSLSTGSVAEHRRLVEDLVAGNRPLDILCVEGFVISGPDGSGRFDTWYGRPKKVLVEELARRAGVVVAVGTCASFGGIGSMGEVEAVGLQFRKDVKGGFLGETFQSREGLPVINLPGCPTHCAVMRDTLSALVSEHPLPLTELNSPQQWYGLLVHQGCLRNEYHEFRVEERDFGERGCLFFYKGCRGPLTNGPCNKVLWNRRSSKTNVGVPCVGCTHPTFPQPYPFFQTRNIADVPMELPDGVDRAHYLAYKGMAAAAAPERLKKRKTRL